MISETHNEDCMIGMARYPDNYFDLAVVDPPYGIGVNMNQGRRKNDKIKHKKKGWDLYPPDREYWIELLRISINQIVWGANNFSWIPANSGWIVWDKDISGDVGFSRAELAYNSVSKIVDMVRIRAQTGPETYTHKIHPTQKPVKLYDWIYKNYLPDGGKVIDTHLGSGSNRIAAHKAGNIDFTGFELDTEYYEAAEKRYKEFISQLTLF